ncbi:uncharacterized protein LOC133849206 isoform X3 [Drosophila sulfurigaster albostrigata]|uniref:uncharacterized protein LOC133849206 isoform X3 n=1 Tax=Drosophila sulfurigaster albostrigata TaxID=89887 RepID=UPI002D21C418|nr:uncharacterized protein LOC133849206 isoform X3 [Drosophila sulfurigaster albostrigata]
MLNDALCDNCQLAKIANLNLTDQMALYEAIDDNSNRIRKNLIYTWTQQSRIELYSEDCEMLENNRSLLNIFMSSISVKVEQMKLERAPMEFLKICENYSLPRVQALSYTLDDSRSRVEAQQILTKIFPDVRCVKPDKRICYCSLSKWTQFRTLIIREEFLWRDPNHYCNLRHCTLIEELIAPDIYIMSHSLDGFMPLPKLRTITICVSRRYINTPLNALKSIDKYGGTEGNTDNIRGLMLDGVWCTYSDLCGVVISLRNLVRLDLDRCSCFIETHLWTIVAKSPSLEILDITRMNLGRHFFSKNRRLMNRTMRNRHAHLTVIYANIGINEVLIRRYFTHPRLQLIPDHKNQKNVLGPIIKVESNPLHEI